MTSDELVIINEWGEELPISSNNENFCMICGETITEENDSGWERFREDGITTQKICKDCDSKEEFPQTKSEK